MRAKEFTSGLLKIMPKQGNLKNLGLTYNAIKRITESHVCKQYKKEYTEEGDEILNLISNYDVSKLEIAMITFFSKIKQTSDYYIIGEVESDSLVMKKKTYELLVLDEFDGSNVLWYCAKNGSKFLDALLYCVSFFNKRLLNDSLWEDQDLILLTVNECANIAGGKKYEDFFKMLLGYW